MMMNPEERINYLLKRMALVLGWMLIAAGALWALGRLWVVISWLLGALSPFLIALVLAYIFNPIVTIVQGRLRLGRLAGIIVVALLLILIIGVFMGVLAPLVYEQGMALVKEVRENAPPLINKATSFLGIDKSIPDKLGQWFSEISQNLKTSVGSKKEVAGNIAGGAMAGWTLAKGIGSVFTGVFGALATSLLVIVIAFYYLSEFDAIPHLLRLILPTRYENRTMDVLGKMDEAVGGFLRGQLIASSIIALLSAIGLAAIGLWQYAILIGMVAGIGSFIPYLGPVLGATPAVLWAFLSSAHQTWGQRFLYAGLVVGIFALVQTVDGLFSQPRIVGKSSHLHPLVVIGALVLGAQLGITGMILAVPVASAVRVLILEFWWNEHVAGKRRAWELAIAQETTPQKKKK